MSMYFTYCDLSSSVSSTTSVGPEGATGMVVKVEGHVLIILSDTTKEHVRYFCFSDVLIAA